MVLVPQGRIFAQFDPHPELEWYTIETEHFYVTYHTGTERTAKTVAKIAEEVYGPITSLYKYEPTEKVYFIVNDVSDIANGATDYYGNRIEIYASPLDYDLRGTHNWLRNVITHEFTHAIQIQASLKFSRKVPALYAQWLNYENERRPDVLYGYPNVIVSYPISGVGVPAWFAEGTAQYQRQQLGYDHWDANRDMILRMYALDNNMLTWNEMGQFSSITSLKAESIYNSGFGLTRYIADKYGEEKLREISENLGDFTNFSMDKAIKGAIGKDGEDLYNEWQAYLKSDYNKRVELIRANHIEGELIEKTGFANYFPHFSPDGSKIAYLSNQTFDYGTTGLFIYDVNSKRTKLLASPVTTNFSWSPDGKSILFARRNSPPTIHHETVFDLYEINVNTEDEKKLTERLRAFSPSYSPDGTSIVFIVNRDGTLNLRTADRNGKNVKVLTSFNNGEQIFNPRFTPDGKRIVFDFALNESRKLGIIDAAGGSMEFFIEEPEVDTRSAEFSKDGTKMYFASNKTGIFNIYSYDMNTGAIRQVTNVLGGAFMPSVDGNGNMTYASYHSTGFKIALLKDYREQDSTFASVYNPPAKLIERYSNLDSASGTGNSTHNWKELRNFNDRELPTYTSKPYTSLFTQLAFFPLIRYDNYSKSNKFLDALKPGLYFYSDEVLGRFSIFGGAAMNKNFERDLFLQFTYNNGIPFFKDFFLNELNFLPKFSLEGYNVTRKTTADLIASIDTIPVDIEYDLLAFDLSMAWKMINVNHDFKFTFSYNKYASKIGAFVIPQSGIGVRASSEDYFKSNNFSFSYAFEDIYPTRHSDINPIGREVNIKYDYEISDINPELEVQDDGTVIRNFQKNKLHKLDADVSQSVGLFNNMHSLTLKLRGATVFGPPVDDFYHFYATGLPGMRGYPFYALGGGRVATATLTYRFPLATNIDTRISPLYLDKLYMSVYGDFGNAWDGDNVKLKDFKKDIGAQLRLQTYSFYVFPTSIFFDAAYGLDEFTRTFQNNDVTYGKEWRFYFGMLFGFDL